jgi:RNA polymerase sigma factor (TIGR02999 family)
MPDGPSANLTLLLKQWGKGDKDALERLMPLVYEQLQRIARHYLKSERGSHTLESAALVHEAFIRMIDQRDVDWQNRAHFFGIASQMMRRILVDHARKRHAAKREAAVYRLSVAERIGPLAAEEREPDLLALDEAIDALATLDADQARVVELRFFGGLTIEETAEAMGTSPATVKREWSTAKLWLSRRIRKGRSAEA